MFGLSFLLGNALLDKTIYGHSFAETMADQHFARLQDYVEKEAISVDHLQRLNEWCSRGEKVYLTIYQDDALIYQSHISKSPNSEFHPQNYDPNIEDPDSEYALTLSGDVKVRAFLYYYAGDSFYFFLTIFSGLLAFFAFSLLFIGLVSRKVAYIGQLQQELDILASGQLEYPVTITGKDELAKLATGIDQMRRSILQHQEAEAQMRSANSELITAMSHDLRTPLTSLLAYLEILDRKKYTNEEQMHSLIHKSVGQTMRIKQMTDKLFAYFLAYATQWEHAALEPADADQLFQQILGDYAYALESNGMRVETQFVPTEAKICINGELLQRALDNLYFNLLKYADKEAAIQISYRAQGQSIVLTISNKIRTKQDKTDSISIGLITCRRIVEYHKGYFAADENNDSFLVTVSIPMQK